ncbi:MAG: ABC transporter substrate-binding protein [Phormidesmis sp.]
MRRLNRHLSQNLSVILSLISLLVVLSVTACSHIAAAEQPAEFRIGYQSVPNAELLTKGLGLVEAKFPDVRVKWIPYSSGRNVLLAMVQDKIDVGLSGSVPAAAAIAQKLPIQVYFIHNIIGDNEALAVTKTANVQSIDDLVGKTIGVPFGSTAHFSLLSALHRAGIEASNVKILDMQPAEILSAWKRGTLDGSFTWQPTLGKLIADNGSVILTAGQLANAGIVTADLGIVSQRFVSGYPDFLASYVSLLDEAVQRYRGNAGAAARAIAPELNLSPQESLAVMNQLIWLDAGEQASKVYMGTPGDPGAISQILESSAEFMVAQKAIPFAPGLATFQAGLFNQAIEQALEQETYRQT